MKTNIGHGAVAAVLALFAIPALAVDSTPNVVQAKVTLSGFQYTLTDLKTSDWVTPSLKIQGQVTKVEASGFGLPTIQSLKTGVFDGTTSSVSGSTQYVPAGTAVATKAGNSLTSQVNLSSGTLEQFRYIVINNGPYASSGASVTSSSGTSWLLSANTQLVVTGVVNLDMNINLENQISTGLGFDAVGSYNLSLVTSVGDVNTTVGSDSGELLAGWRSYRSELVGADVLHNSLSRSFSFTVSNNSSKSLLVGLNMNEYASGAYFQANPVPEPGTFALMGLGLGLIGWRARARRA